PQRPAIYGKQDERGERLFPVHGELDPDSVARLVGLRLLARARIESISKRLERVTAIGARPKHLVMVRAPSFCSGCPHNRSTIVPEGMEAGGGIGCHGLAGRLRHIQRGFTYITQMGGEGAPWIGIAPFTETPHLFQNVGDGTFFHSATLAVNACVSAGVNITFKVLYNG